MEILNKRGSLLDMFLIVGVLFAVAISILIGRVVFTEFADYDTIQADTNSKAIVDQGTDTLYQSLDGMFSILFIGVFIVTAILAYMTRSHPAFFPVSAFIVLPLLVLISAIISNVYEEVVSNGTFAAENGIMAAYIMGYLPFFMFGYGIILLVVMYGLNKSEGL